MYIFLLNVIWGLAGAGGLGGGSSPKRLEKMSALSALPPSPPLSTIRRGTTLFAFAEAVAAGKRPRSATGSGSAGCLHDRHYTTLLFWGAAGPLTGRIPNHWGDLPDP